jgi:hypothetical protein
MLDPQKTLERHALRNFFGVFIEALSRIPLFDRTTAVLAVATLRMVASHAL